MTSTMPREHRVRCGPGCRVASRHTPPHNSREDGYTLPKGKSYETLSETKKQR